MLTPGHGWHRVDGERVVAEMAFGLREVDLERPCLTRDTPAQIFALHAVFVDENALDGVVDLLGAVAH
ncbi:hypothetical protein [Mycolicibacterium fortuitum]|uniref:hypothetical protein n=1 Tax=Mycolicibacterium fortuitum TaxID=1766 RepID=UPI003AAC038F